MFQSVHPDCILLSTSGVHGIPDILESYLLDPGGCLRYCRTSQIVQDVTV